MNAAERRQASLDISANPILESQEPGHELPIPNSKGAQSPKLKNRPARILVRGSRFGVWCLRFGTSLEPGVWCLEFRPAAGVPPYTKGCLRRRFDVRLPPAPRLGARSKSMRSFETFTEKEILALAIALEEEDARIYDDFADGLKEKYPEQAEKFKELRREEDTHRHRLLEIYKQRFGDHVPLIRRQDVRGFVQRRPVWLVRPLGLKAVQKAAETMEVETKRFYEVAARRATAAGVRQLLGDLAEEERNHAQTAEHIAETKLSDDESARQKRLFVLQVIQPGLAGLMDGSVST